MVFSMTVANTSYTEEDFVLCYLYRNFLHQTLSFGISGKIVRSHLNTFKKLHSEKVGARIL